MTPDIVKMRDLAMHLKVQASRRAKGNEGLTLEHQAYTAITTLADALKAANARVKELELKIEGLHEDMAGGKYMTPMDDVEAVARAYGEAINNRPYVNTPVFRKDHLTALRATIETLKSRGWNPPSEVDAHATNHLPEKITLDILA